MTRIDDLCRICPPPGGTPHVDWAAVEHALGMPLPADYKQLADAYGPGEFCGFIHLYHPHAPTPWVNLTGPMPTTIRQQLQHDHDSGTRPAPHDPQHLFPIGVTDNGEYLYWITEPPIAPDQWHVALTEARGPLWHTHEGGIADFLVAVLTGREEVPLFPEDLLDQGVYFTPYAPGPPEPYEEPEASVAISTQEVRAWARAHGYDVPDRGRIPGAVIDAWREAHGQ
ncbi:hypothetical protein GCM10010218_22790 [Streptomyces mashuensis]|uniref:Knr4/Smi1-like domain-containing protein n=1 Tax=Streptomyces mashuensis TaxID=33904 RepID=A0A919B203_9ACTN|nr:histone-like nucleoid-structuring protein Lsr2 [Streptomyces mashuensis]GHF40817.1 hypothetical protein GCM10010218_22790 [Streptomyces mashuensis]